MSNQEVLRQAAEHLRGGHAALAESLCVQALLQDPGDAEAEYLLGRCRAAQGQPAEAEHAFRRALTIRPDHAEAHFALGLALRRQNRLVEAETAYRASLRLRPRHGAAAFNLGNVLQAQHRHKEAVAAYRQALEIRPEHAEAQCNLGAALAALGNLDEAIAAYAMALALKPDHAAALCNLGTALLAQGKAAEAVESFRQALQFQPRFAEAANNLGNALRSLGRLQEALEALTRALEIQPGFAEAENNLGRTLMELHRIGDAEAAYRRALAIRPDLAEAVNNLGNALKEQGRTEEAAAVFWRAVALRPDYAVAHSNALMTEHYLPGVTLGRLAELHADWDQRHARPLQASWRPHANSRDPGRRLRLGFLSADFKRHPVAYLLGPALAALKNHDCDTVCYADVAAPDDLTAALTRVARVWADVAGWPNEKIADRIRADRIDILFDLAGHTGHNRLLVFARKPAPIQISWIGYIGTTGLAAMDYLLADHRLVPAGAEMHYREKVLRLPDGYACYGPPSDAPDVGPLPALAAGHVTFGSFNNLAKITPQVVETWARIMHRVPGSRLVLKYTGLAEAGIRQQYLARFAAHGITADRIEMQGWAQQRDMLKEYNRIDLALDPFPFTGGLTTCAALWMGVPVVTCPGETFASRMSLSHLVNIGLGELAAADLPGFIDLAAGLAGDLHRLADLRAGLRPRMAQSSLCNGRLFADNLMGLLRQVWQEWCQKDGRE